MYSFHKFLRKQSYSNFISNFPKYSNFNSLFNTSKFFFSEEVPGIIQTVPTNIIEPSKAPLASPQQTIPPNQQLAETGKKSPQQLNIEKLLQQWPESIKNPKTDIALDMKRTLESVYKWHQGDKNYHKEEDLPMELYNEVSHAFCASFTTDTVTHLFDEYDGFLTDQQIADKFELICFSHQDYTKDYYEKIVPKVKDVLMKADKQSGKTISKILRAACRAQLGDKEFWEIAV